MDVQGQTKNEPNMTLLDPIELPDLVLFVAVGYIFLAIASIWMERGSRSVWYRGLAKAPWNPPGWVFGLVWFVMAGLVGVAGFYAYRANTSVTGGVKTAVNTVDLNLYYAALGLYWAQLFPAALWGMVFFVMRNTLGGLALIMITLAASAATTVLFFLISTTAGAIYVFYTAWLLFATTLNAYIWWANEFVPHSLEHTAAAPRPSRGGSTSTRQSRRRDVNV